MTDHSLCFRSVYELGELIRNRAISPVDLVQAYLGRIAAVKPALNSWITLVPEQALREARKAEDEIGKGNYRGPLHGIPFGLKDLYATKGIRTTYGCAAYDRFIPDKDSAAVVRLRKAGAILLGKTNLHTLALGPTGQNEHYGDMPNPWNPDCYAGGSSGGSASAVAAGECAFALGTDSGGSIRMPAGLCGIVGFKPTFGLLSRQGIMELSPSMDHQGPMTRTVKDCAIVLQTLSDHDSEFPARATGATTNYRGSIQRGVKGLKIGIPREFFKLPIDPEVHRTVLAALKRFVELGAILKRVNWPMVAYSQTISSAILAVDAAHSLRALLLKHPRKIDSAVRNRIASGFFISAVGYLQVQRWRAKLKDQIYKLLEEVDLIAGPTLGVPAPKIGEKEIVVAGTKMSLFKALPLFVRPFNLTGLPAISICCGFTGGNLPVGLQIAGRPFCERTVLRAAYAYETANSWQQKHPSL
jgi:aspartyl-tRNA(Asn)/glutamyl-tRNA(Gln) amidotransferase subunit A